MLKLEQLKRNLIGLFFLTLAAALVSIYFFDQKISLVMSQPAFKDRYWQFFRSITDIGLGENYFAIAITLFVFCKFFATKILKNKMLLPGVPRLQKFSVWLFWSLASSGIGLHIFKFTIGRARPLHSPDFNPLIFSPFNSDSYFQSMPSGHSQVMFTVATVVGYFWPKFMPSIFSLAMLIGFSRIATLQHTLSDVIVGAFVGWAFSMMTMFYLDKRLQKAAQKKV